jgi:hypothetical protein
MGKRRKKKKGVRRRKASAMETRMNSPENCMEWLGILKKMANSFVQT